MTHSSCLFLVAIAAVGPCLGCRRAPSSHDHHHLEHHTPAHKPANLVAGAAAISRRWQMLEAIGDAGERSTRLERWTELTDIIRWLPELAADSDMPEDSWNRVNSLSEQLLSRWEPALDRFAAGGDARPPRLADHQPLLVELEKLAAEHPEQSSSQLVTEERADD